MLHRNRIRVLSICTTCTTSVYKKWKMENGETVCCDTRCVLTARNLTLHDMTRYTSHITQIYRAQNDQLQ